MAGTITTTGTTADPVNTKHQPPESVQQWVVRHDKKLETATPSGNTLVTTWPCATGTETVTTDRLAGESNAAFVQRHVTAYLLAMIECPPVP